MSSVAITADQAVPQERSTIYVAEQMWTIRWQLYVGFIALAIGGFIGLLQALERVGVDWYSEVQLKSYYQGLTLHGVLLVLVFTFSFANSFLSLTTIRGFGRPLASTMLAQASFVALAAGVVLAGYAMFADKATVLFTFYPPLKATPLYYIGAVFLVVSTWLVLANQLLTLRAWRADNPRERIPLLSYVSIVTYIMWTVASVGIAIEVLIFVLPWSLGWTDTIDPQFTRILFWLTGHPIVYFWLLPAYVSWYMMIPRQVSGRLYSDGLTRLVFLLFLLYSTPVGLHHQFSDPGISSTMRFVHTILTFIVILPSLATAFSIMAALEMGGKRNGGKGLFGWILRLPWRDPSVTAQLLAMLVFTLGGITGSINASYTVNSVVHNTAFIPGHFHMTVGTAVALSIMGITYWLLPFLTGRQLFMPRLALAQAWLWAAGILVFARGQISGGLEGMPRRTAIGASTYNLNAWDLSHWLTAIGGSLMAFSGLLFFIVIIGTLLNSKSTAITEMPIAQPLHGPRESWDILDNLGFWTLIGILLILIAYAPVIVSYWPLNSESPGLRVW